MEKNNETTNCSHQKFKPLISDSTHEVCMAADTVLFGSIGHPKR